MIEQFWLFHCGWMRVPRVVIVSKGGYDMPILPFLAGIAYHKEHGPILIDAPFGHEGPANMGDVHSTLLQGAGLRFKEEWSIIPRLEQLGFRAADVRHILMTHLHSDHTGGMKELCHATFHVARQEWEDATDSSLSFQRRLGYIPADYRAIHGRMNLLDIPETSTWAPARDLPGVDVFGDGSVEAVFLPGHTRGHLGYRFHMTDGRRLFHLGDAAYCLTQLTQNRGIGVMGRRVAQSLDQANATIGSLRDFHTRYPDEVLLTSHDFGWGLSCLDGPTALHEL